MLVQSAIEATLTQAIDLAFFEIINESHMHSVPENSETHFNVCLVSTEFEGLTSVKRHQRIYGLLAEQLKGPVHALALHTYTPQEWQEKNGEIPASPNCLGGSKADKQ